MFKKFFPLSRGKKQHSPSNPLSGDKLAHVRCESHTMSRFFKHRAYKYDGEE